ncbi:glycoside hydrolase family 2 protein [Lewinella sp. LCG006]|uniref:glycoside hydrolase family 2 protein n=1 Tax=Lewinella sp. LCG006 TaxID=3231911 RepID=UPI003460C3FE
MNRLSFLLPAVGLFFSLLLMSQILMGQEVLRESLSTGWTIKSTEFSDAEELSTPVPSTVQEVLSRSGLLPDPYYGTNETEVQWVGERNWEYNLFFTPAAFDTKRAYRLNFTGLDTYAKVYLNDSLILTADNMFRSWQVPVTELLKAGTNHLRVAFTAPIEALAATIENLPYALNKTSVNDTGTPRMANFARKAQFQFGWDWGLRLVTQGIWRPVYLESWEHARLEEVQYFQENLTTAHARMRVQASIDRRSEGNYELRLRDLNTSRLLAKRALTKTEAAVDFNFQIDQPRLWWPNSHGVPHRYHLSLELWRDGELQDQQEKKIGIRTVELVQEPDTYGTSFYFKVNGRPIFTKGASYIPQDAILTRITAQQKTTLLQQTHDAHFNLIRVWGGGIYEDDHFYDQCDSLGLMVWQDFMFACAAYPADPAFLANVEAEVRENVRRLRNHPSIITWCGNNEVDLAMRNWGWQRQYDIKGEDEQDMYRNYTKLFQELIPEVLAEEDPERPYAHTTPLSSYYNASQRGHNTLHYWGVWHGPDDFTGYETKVGRYMNEYGFQSFPDMETIASFADSSQWSLESPVMAHHQKSYIGNGLIGKFTEQYGEPAADFPAFVEQSQKVQYEGIRRAILAHRLRYGYCMGTTFWQLNDCWPAPSWSAIDYYGRPKVLFEELPNLYAPIVAAAVGTPKDPQLAVISDYPGGAEVSLFWTKRQNGNAIVLGSGEKKVLVLRAGTQLIAPPAGMVPGKDEQTEVNLFVQGELMSTFKWSGRQLPIRLPEESDWQEFPELLKE